MRQRRHPAAVTVDRLNDHYERWFDLMTEAERVQIEQVVQVLNEIESGQRGPQ